VRIKKQWCQKVNK